LGAHAPDAQSWLLGQAAASCHVPRAVQLCGTSGTPGLQRDAPLLQTLQLPVLHVPASAPTVQVAPSLLATAPQVPLPQLAA